MTEGVGVVWGRTDRVQFEAKIFFKLATLVQYGRVRVQWRKLECSGGGEDSLLGTHDLGRGVWR